MALVIIDWDLRYVGKDYDFKNLHICLCLNLRNGKVPYKRRLGLEFLGHDTAAADLKS